MSRVGKWSALWLIAIVLGVVAACAPAAPTPTPTTKAAVGAPTPTKPAATPTPAKAIRFGPDGKLERLPDGFPNKSISLVAAEAGSSTDIFMRALGAAAEPFSPVPIVIVNVGGGSDAEFAYARKMSREGYGLSSSTGSMMVYIYTKSLQVDGELLQAKHFKSVYIPNTSPNVLVVKGDAPWKTLKEFLDDAKANPAKVRVTTGGTGNFHHLIAAWLAREAKVQFTIVPEESSAGAIRLILGGGVEAASMSTPAFAPQYEAGKARALATAGSKRMDAFKDVPTYKEQGYDIVYDHFRGVLAPAEVTDLRRDWLMELFRAGAKTKEYQEFIKKQGEEFLDMGAEADAYLKRLDQVASELTTELGMRAKK